MLLCALPARAGAADANVGFATLGISVPKDALAKDALAKDVLAKDVLAEDVLAEDVLAEDVLAEDVLANDAGAMAETDEVGPRADDRESRQTRDARETVGQGTDAALRLDVNIWYPTDSRRQRLLDYQGWTFRAAPRADARKGRHPLILFSHFTSGNRFTHHEAARGLAARGFVVVAPTHPLDNLDAMRDPCSMASLERRARDLSVTLDLLLANETFGPHIDGDRVGVVGFGTGATAALLLGGALPDCSLWKHFCQRTDARDPYCNAWARETIEKDLCPSLPMKASPADARIRAVAAVEPAFSFLFSARALLHCRPRTLLVFGDRDDHESVAKERILLPGRFGPGVETRYVNRANLEAFMSPCPPGLARELPELCLGVEPETRAFARDRLVGHLADFFTRNLVNATPPTRPAPPSPEEPQDPAKGIENGP